MSHAIDQSFRSLMLFCCVVVYENLVCMAVHVLVAGQLHRNRCNCVVASVIELQCTGYRASQFYCSCSVRASWASFPIYRMNPAVRIGSEIQGRTQILGCIPMEYHVKFISFFREIHRSDCVSILVSSISKNIHHCLSELMKTSPLPYPDPPFTAYSYSTRRANPSRNPLDRPARQPRKERKTRSMNPYPLFFFGNLKGHPYPFEFNFHSQVFQLPAMERISLGSLQPSAKDNRIALVRPPL